MRHPQTRAMHTSRAFFGTASREIRILVYTRSSTVSVYRYTLNRSTIIVLLYRMNSTTAAPALIGGQSATRATASEGSRMDRMKVPGSCCY